MRYLHTMIRVADLEASLDFFVSQDRAWSRRAASATSRAGSRWCSSPPPRTSRPARRTQAPLVELTYNWDPEAYTGGRNFGHLAYEVDNIYDYCAKLQAEGIVINRPPATAAWPSSARPTTFRSNSCRPARRCRPLSPGSRCRTRGSGDDQRIAALTQMAIKLAEMVTIFRRLHHQNCE